MKASKKANGKSRSQPASRTMKGAAGHLRAVMYKECGCWKIAIRRQAPDTGEISDELTPADVINLAELTAVIAQALHDYAQLDNTSLSDDLGCLAHNLIRTLGIGPLEAIGFPKPTAK